MAICIRLAWTICIVSLSSTRFYRVTAFCQFLLNFEWMNEWMNEWMELLHGISRHTAPQSLRLPQNIIFVLLPVISLLCRLTHWVHTDVGLSLSLARWHGTHYRNICVIVFTPYLFLDDYLRHFSFQSKRSEYSS